MPTTTPLSELIAFVQRAPLFSNISSTDCGTILSNALEKRFGRRQVIFFEGDPVRQVVMLLSGSVKMSQLGFGGGEVILRISGSGDVIQLSGHRSHVSAQAIQPSTALVWQVATFENLLERFPILRGNTVHALEQRLQELEQRFREVSTEKAGSRLSSELIRLSRRLTSGANGTSVIRLSRAELAQLTGTTIFTVSRLLCEWKRLGIVRIGRETVQIRDCIALMQFSESERIESHRVAA